MGKPNGTALHNNHCTYSILALTKVPYRNTQVKGKQKELETGNSTISKVTKAKHENSLDIL